MGTGLPSAGASIPKVTPTLGYFKNHYAKTKSSRHPNGTNRTRVHQKARCGMCNPYLSAVGRRLLVGVSTVNSPKDSFFTIPPRCALRSIIHSSGIISATSSPWQNKRTTALSETTTARALVAALMLAPAMCRLPSPRGSGSSGVTACKYRQAETMTPSSLTTNAPSSCASSLIVPRNPGSLKCREDSGCPSNGSRINARERARTSCWSPSVKRVPMRRPSRPSRAISTASSISDSSTSGSYSVTWQMMLSNISPSRAGLMPKQCKLAANESTPYLTLGAADWVHFFCVVETAAMKLPKSSRLRGLKFRPSICAIHVVKPLEWTNHRADNRRAEATHPHSS